MNPTLAQTIIALSSKFPKALLNHHHLLAILQPAKLFILDDVPQFTFESILNAPEPSAGLTVHLNRGSSKKTAHHSYLKMLKSIDNTLWRKSMRQFMTGWMRPLSPANSLVKRVWIKYDPSHKTNNPGLFFEIKDPLCTMTVCRLENNEVPRDIFPILYGKRLPQSLLTAVDAGFDAEPSGGRVRSAGYLPRINRDRFHLITQMKHSQISQYLETLNTPSAKSAQKATECLLPTLFDHVQIHSDFGIGEKSSVKLEFFFKTDLNRNILQNRWEKVLEELTNNQMIEPEKCSGLREWINKSDKLNHPSLDNFSITGSISSITVVFENHNPTKVIANWSIHMEKK
jgi:hypothetical protein